MANVVGQEGHSCKLGSQFSQAIHFWVKSFPINSKAQIKFEQHVAPHQ